MKKLKLLLSVSLAFALAIFALALTGCMTTTVTGTVQFSIEDIPVEGAVIIVGDKRATTNADGKFTLAEMPLELASGKVEIEGFPDYEFSLDLSEAEEEHSFSITIPATRLTLDFVENSQVVSRISPDNIIVSFGGEVVTAEDELEASFQTEIIAPGDYVVTVESAVEPKIYEALSETITVEEGIYELEFALQITLDESYQRFNRGNALHRYAETYNFIHSDIRQLLSATQWEGVHNPRANVIDATPGEPELLPEWESGLTGNTYENVAAIERSFMTELGDSRIASTETQHWVLSEGRWYIVYDRKFW